MNIRFQHSDNLYHYQDLLATDFFRFLPDNNNLCQTKTPRGFVRFGITYLNNGDFAFFRKENNAENSPNLSKDSLVKFFSRFPWHITLVNFNQFPAFFAAFSSENLAFRNQPEKGLVNGCSQSIAFHKAPEIEYLFAAIWDYLFQRGTTERKDESIKNFVAFINDVLSQISPLQWKNNHLLKHHLPAIARGKNFIFRNFKRELSIHDLAAYCYVSPYHFSRLFKQFTGYTPGAYVHIIRLKQAEILLKGTSLPIKEIGKQCGFRRPDYFSAAFKRKFRLSPIQFQSQFITKN